MTLQRLDAIATGILAVTAGCVMIGVVWTPVWETWQQALRQQQTVGTVVALETTQVCRSIQRGAFAKCTRLVKEKCPIVQYQPPEVSQPLKLKDCSQTASVGMVFDVVYDRQTPSDARLGGQSDLLTHGVPLFLASVPMGVGGLLLVLGGYKLWQGIRDRA